MKRERVFRRDRYRCVYCGIEGIPADLTVDHVEPQMRGGDQSEGNLVTCCKACNTLKGSQPAWSYLKTNAAARTNFLEAASNCAAGHAAPVWPRLVRAIEEAAARRPS